MKSHTDVRVWIGKDNHTRLFGLAGGGICMMLGPIGGAVVAIHFSSDEDPADTLIAMRDAITAALDREGWNPQPGPLPDGVIRFSPG